MFALPHHNFNSSCRFFLVLSTEPPFFLEEPRDISIGLHKSTFAVCRASSSNVKPMITWNKILLPDNAQANVGGVDGLTGSAIDKDIDTRRKSIFTGEQLHLTNVRLEDAGVYECVAQNPHNGLAISHTFTLTVNGRSWLLNLVGLIVQEPLPHPFHAN